MTAFILGNNNIDTMAVKIWDNTTWYYQPVYVKKKGCYPVIMPVVTVVAWVFLLNRVCGCGHQMGVLAKPFLSTKMHLLSDCRVQTSLWQRVLDMLPNVIWCLGFEVETRRELLVFWRHPQSHRLLPRARSGFKLLVLSNLESKNPKIFSLLGCKTENKTMRVMRCFCFALWTGWMAWGGQHRAFESGTWSSDASSSRRPAGWVSAPSSISAPSRRSAPHCRCPWQPQLPADFHDSHVDFRDVSWKSRPGRSQSPDLSTTLEQPSRPALAALMESVSFRSKLTTFLKLLFQEKEWIFAWKLKRKSI